MPTLALFPGLDLPAEHTHSSGDLDLSVPHTAVVHNAHRTDFPADSLKLETRGTTSHLTQTELFSRQMVYKSSVVAKLIEAGSPDIAEPLKECHTSQGWAECKGCKATRTFWNRCDRFYCPSCQPRLARERFESLEWWTKTISQPKHVVLTVRNVDAISQQYIRWLKSCRVRLIRRKIARNWKGGLWSMEVTNEGKGWHVHLHLLVNAQWIDNAELARQWADLVGQDFAIVKVKDCRSADYLREVTKYAVKGSELAKWTGEQITHFVNAFTGGKNFGVFGELYGKRTEWREWIKSLGATKGLCECGCSEWEIYNADQWAMHKRYLCIVKSGIPPPD